MINFEGEIIQISLKRHNLYFKRIHQGIGKDSGGPGGGAPDPATTSSSTLNVTIVGTAKADTFPTFFNISRLERFFLFDDFFFSITYLHLYLKMQINWLHNYFTRAIFLTSLLPCDTIETK